MATLAWIDFTKHNQATSENVRAFSVNHPIAGRLVVIKGVTGVLADNMAQLGFTQTVDGSFVIRASQLNVGALQRSAFPLLGLKHVELADIDLTAQFVQQTGRSQPEPLQAEPAHPNIHPGLNWISKSAKETDEPFSAFEGILPSTVALSLWNHLDETASKEELLNGQTVYRGSVDGKAYALIKRPILLGGPQKIKYFEADNESLMPDINARQKIPAIFQISDAVKTQIAEMGDLYLFQIATHHAEDYSPSRKLIHALGQRALNATDAYEGTITKVSMSVSRPFVIASAEFNEGVNVGDLVEAFGHDDVLSMIHELEHDDWIVPPGEDQLQLDASAVIRAYALVSQPDFVRALLDRGADAAVYYRKTGAELDSRESFISDNNVALFVKPIGRALVTPNGTEALFNMSKVPPGFALIPGDGLRAGQIALTHVDTGELVRNGDNTWFGSLTSAVESISLPENTFFVNPTTEDIEHALADVFVEPVDVIAYRGEHGNNEQGTPFHSREGAISFGSERVARIYGSEPNNRQDVVVKPRVIEARIVIKNPLVNSPADPYIDLSLLANVLGEERAKIIALGTRGYIEQTNNFQELADEHNGYVDEYNVYIDSVETLLKEAPQALNQLYVDAFAVFDNNEWVQWLKEEGYDGAVHGGMGESEEEPEYKIFDASQATILNVIELPLPLREDATAAAPLDLDAIQTSSREHADAIKALVTQILSTADNSPERVDALRMHKPALISQLTQFGESISLLEANGISEPGLELPDLIEIGDPSIAELYNSITETDVELTIVSISATLAENREIGIAATEPTEQELSVTLTQIEGALVELTESRNFEEAGIRVTKEGESVSVSHRGVLVCRYDGDVNRRAVSEALLREFKLAEYTNTTFYELIANREEALKAMQDILDPHFNARYMELRAALLERGYSARDRSPVYFSPSNESTVRAEFRHMGVGKNLVGITYHVGPTQLRDNLSQTPAEIAEELHALVEAAERQAEALLPAKPKSIRLEDIESMEVLETTLLSGIEVIEGEKSYSVVETANSGWTVVESERGVSVTKGGDPRGNGYSKSEAVDRIVNALEYHFLIEDAEPVIESKVAQDANATEPVESNTPAPMEDMFGDLPAGPTRFITITRAPSPKYFLVSGDGLSLVDSELDDLGGKFLKTAGAYRFQKSSENGVRSMLNRVMQDKNISIIDNIRKPFALAVGKKVADSAGATWSVLEIKRRNETLEVELEKDGNKSFMIMQRHTTAELMQGDFDVHINNWDELNSLYPLNSEAPVEINAVEASPVNEQPMVTIVESMDAAEPVPESEPFPEFAVIRGKAVERIGRNNDNEFLYRGEDGLRHILQVDGSAISESPFVDSNRDFVPPLQRLDQFKLLSELEAEQIAFDNVVPLRAQAAQTGSADETLKEITKEDLDKQLAGTGIDSALLTDFIQAYGKYRMHLDTLKGKEPTDFTSRRLSLEVDKKLNIIQTIARSNRYGVDRKMFFDVADSIYEGTERKISQMTNSVMSLAIERMASNKPVVTLDDAIDLAQSNAIALPPYWVNEQLKKCEQRDDYKTFIVLFAKVYGTPEERNQAAALVARGMDEPIQDFAKDLQKKYGKTRAIIELPSMIAFSEKTIAEYTGVSPRLKDTMEHKISDYFNELAKAQYDIDAIEISDSDIEAYRTASSFTDSAETFAERHGLSYDAGRNYAERVSEFLNARILAAFAEAEETEITLEAASLVRTRMPDGVVVESGSTPESAGIRFRFGAGTISVSRPDKTEDGYNVYYRYSASHRYSSEFDKSGLVTYPALPTSEQLAQDTLSFAQLSRTEVNAYAAPVYGAKLDSLPADERHNATAIAKRVREDFKHAIKLGNLPKGIKLSVRSERNSINVRITDVPENFTAPNPAYALHRKNNPGWAPPPHGMSRYSHEGQALLTAVEGYLNAYNYDKSDSQSDYFDVNYYGDVHYSGIDEESYEKSLRLVVDEEANNAAYQVLNDEARYAVSDFMSMGFIYTGGRRVGLDFTEDGSLRAISSSGTTFFDQGRVLDENGLSVARTENAEPLLRVAYAAVHEVYALANKPFFAGKVASIAVDATEPDEKINQPESIEQGEGGKSEPVEQIEIVEPEVSIELDRRDGTFTQKHTSFHSEIQGLGSVARTFPSPLGNTTVQLYEAHLEDGTYQVGLHAGFDSADVSGALIQIKNAQSNGDALLAGAKAFEEYAGGAFKHDQMSGIAHALVVLNYLENRLGRNRFTSNLIIDAERKTATQGIEAVIEHFQNLAEQTNPKLQSDIFAARTVALAAIDGVIGSGELQLGHLVSGRHVWGADLALANGYPVSVPLSDSNRSYETEADAAAAFVRSIAALTDDAKKAEQALIDQLAQAVPITRGAQDLSVPDFTNVEAYNEYTATSRRLAKLETSFANAETDSERSRIQSDIDGLMAAREKALIVLMIDMLNANDLRADDFDEDYVNKLAALYPDLRTAWNQYRLQEARSGVQPDADLVALWLREAGLHETHTLEGDAIVTAQPMPKVSSVGVSEAINTDTLESSFSFDLNTIEPEEREVFANQARLAGALVDGTTLRFSNKENLDTFATENALPVSIISSSEAAPSPISTSDADANISISLKKELEKAGYVKTQLENVWLGSTENNGAIQLTFYKGAAEKTLDVKYSYAKYGHNTEHFLVGLQDSTLLTELEASINESLVENELPPLKRPLFTPSYAEISDEDVCRVLLGAGLNVEESPEHGWVVSGETYAQRHRLNHLGGECVYPKNAKAQWVFSEPPAKKLAVLISEVVEWASPRTEIDGIFASVAYNANDNHFVTTIDKGDPAKKIIVGSHSSLSKARTSILTSILDSKKLSALWERAHPQVSTNEETTPLEEYGNERSTEPNIQTGQSDQRQDTARVERQQRDMADRAVGGSVDRVDGESRTIDRRAGGQDRSTGNGSPQQSQLDTGRPSPDTVSSENGTTQDDGGILGVSRPSDLFNLKEARLDHTPSPSELTELTSGALKTLQLLRDEKRLATPEEKIKLSRMVGLGAGHFNSGKTAIFSGYDQDSPNARLRKLINQFPREEVSSLRSTILTAFYTPGTITDFMWSALNRMGLNNLNRPLDIVDPGFGTGNFIGSAPMAIRQTANIQGVECDKLTAEIAAHLYPEVRVINKEFQDVLYPASSKDLFVGNPPYSDVRTFNPRTGKREVLHDLFLRESIQALRPGGMVAFVTSSGTMDKKGTQLRQFISTSSDLICAFRLPTSAFKADAGTEVMTDVLFFRKRKQHEQPRETDWVNTTIFDETAGDNENSEARKVTINQYFVNHPENVLGDLKITTNQFGFTLTCESNGNDLESLLNQALSQVPANQFNPEAKVRLVRKEDADTQSKVLGEQLNEGQKVGELTIGEDGTVQIIRYDGSQARYYADPAPVKASNIELIKSYIGLRDLARSLITLEQKSENPEIAASINAKRAELNQAYDAFVTTHGPLGRKANNKVLRQDPGYYFTAQLEIYDKDKDEALKADIFKRRVINAAEVPVISVPEDAVYFSMSNHGHIVPGIVEDLLGRDWNEVREELGETVFFDPTAGKYFTKSVYLSGDVIEKLESAERALPDRPEMQLNIEALQSVIPKTIPITSIRVKIGATWIPEQILTDFARDILKATAYHKRDKVSVTYNETLGSWNFKVTDLVLREAAQANNIEYGTRDVPFNKIFKHCLDQTRPTVYVELDNGSREVHQEATQAARDKQALIEESFVKFILDNTERAAQAEKAYNYQMNRFVPNDPDGKYLTFPGVTAELKGKPFAYGKHQLGVIERALTSQYGLLIAHEAGGGKTISTVTIAMKSKQLSIAKKPMIAVPNHMLVQYTEEALDLYPNARILTVSKDDLSKEGREQFAYKCQLNDWDLVICTHEQFRSMKMPKWYVENTILNDIAELEEMLLSGDGDRATEKQLERQKKALTEKLKSTIAELEQRQDDIDFTSLGIDWIAYDEAHYLKNRAFPTRNSSLAGVQSLTSQRALDAEMKFDWVRESRGDSRGVLLATGTPISNTIGEAMVILRYLAPALLKRAGINNFDDFIANFGETKMHVELTADGSGYQLKERLSGFHNIPELMRLFIQVADIKMGDQLDLKRPEENRIMRVSEMSPEQRMFMDWLSYRARKVKAGAVEPSKDNMLSIYTDLQTISIDPRLYHHKLQDAPESKVNKEVESIYEQWEKGKETLNTQLIFVDRFQKTIRTPDGFGKNGKPKVKSTVVFNLIDDMKQKLIAKGIPAEQIGSIHDANSDEEKEGLFSQIRKGRVRITFASTAKMGVGTNVQTRGKDLRHLSYPMRAIDIEQRNKRFVRQGNMHEKVNLHYPTTKDSGDLALLQMIERKDKMTRQIMSCDFENMARSFDEDFTPSYEDIMAVTTGNTLIKDKLETDSLVDKYRRQSRAHDHQCYEARRWESILRTVTIPNMESYVAKSKRLAQLVKPESLENFQMRIGGKTFDKPSLAGAVIHALAKKVSLAKTSIEIGEFLGHPLSIELNRAGAYNLRVDIDGETFISEITENLKYFPSRLGTLVGSRINGVQEGLNKIQELKAQAEEALLLSQKPFPHAQALVEAEEKLAKLNVELAKAEANAPKEELDGPHPFEVLLAQLNGETVLSNDNKQNNGLLSEEEITRALTEEGLDSSEVQSVKELTLTR